MTKGRGATALPMRSPSGTSAAACSTRPPPTSPRWKSTKESRHTPALAWAGPTTGSAAPTRAPPLPAPSTRPASCSFAYARGPAYGLLLDQADPGWHRRLDADADLGALLARAHG